MGQLLQQQSMCARESRLPVRQPPLILCGQVGSRRQLWTSAECSLIRILRCLLYGWLSTDLLAASLLWVEPAPGRCPAHYSPAHYSPAHYSPAHYSPAHYSPAYRSRIYRSRVYRSPGHCSPYTIAVRAIDCMHRCAFGGAPQPQDFSNSPLERGQTMGAGWREVAVILCDHSP